MVKFVQLQAVYAHGTLFLYAMTECGRLFIKEGSNWEEIKSPRSLL